MNKQHIGVLSCCHGEPQCCSSCEKSCTENYAGQVRNPEYPRGMTMGELITNTEMSVCLSCGRSPQSDNDWTDDDHARFCSVPFMRAALMKIAVLEHEKWQINRDLERLRTGENDVR